MPVSEADGLIGSARPPSCPCTGWPEQSGRLGELQLCAQPRRGCTFSHFHLNASRVKAKPFSSDPVASQIKTGLSVCLLVTLRGSIYCLRCLWAAAVLAGGGQLGHPGQTDTPWVVGLAWTRHAGAEAEGPMAAEQRSKDIQKGDCSFPRRSLARGSVASSKARQR